MIWDYHELLKAMFNDFDIDQRPYRMHALTLPIITSEVHLSLMAQGRQKSWKAFCYIICMMQRIQVYNTYDNPPSYQAIVICPTTELANWV